MLKKVIELFDVKRMRVMIDFKDNPMVIHLPVGAGYVESDGNIVSFEKVRIDFQVLDLKGVDTEVFQVCVDDIFFINHKYQLIDDHTKAQFFGKDGSTPSGKSVPYASIYHRAMSVSAAICVGKIKLSPDVDIATYYKCQSCDEVVNLDDISDSESEGDDDISGICPNCSKDRFFQLCDKDGKFL